MIVLLVSDHIYELFGAEIVVAQQCGAEVLRHVDACAVAAQQQLLVEAVARQVAPHRAILLAEQYAHIQTFLHQLFAEQIGVRLIVHLVESHTQAVVGLVEAGIHPAVHLLPQRTHLLVTLFPLLQHLLGLDHQGGLLLGLLLLYPTLHQLFDLILIVFVELHIVLAHQVVTLHAARLGRLAVAVAHPGQHTLADVDAAVVHQIHLLHIGTGGGQQLAYRPTEEVVSDMT